MFVFVFDVGCISCYICLHPILEAGGEINLPVFVLNNRVSDEGNGVDGKIQSKRQTFNRFSAISLSVATVVTIYLRKSKLGFTESLIGPQGFFEAC